MSNSQESALLQIKDVSHRYSTGTSNVDALKGVNIDIKQGEFICIVGPSGCGKTTLLNMIAGFISPTSGQVLIDGGEIQKPNPQRGVVFQQPNLYPWLNLRENVTFGPRMAKAKPADYGERVDEILKLVSLNGFEDSPPYELSGGMQQRASIARVLVNDPAVMLMDEPFGALDALIREKLQEMLLDVWRKTSKTVFFITHSVEEAVYLGNRVLVMAPRPGRVVYEEEMPDFEGKSLRWARTDEHFAELQRRITEVIYDS